jgi:hypothetical protein
MVVQRGLVGIARARSAFAVSDFWREVQGGNSIESRAPDAGRPHTPAFYDRIESFSPGKAHKTPMRDCAWLLAPT